METLTQSSPPTGVPGRSANEAADTNVDFTTAEFALLKLGQELKVAGYRFTTITPATHARVLARAVRRASLRDIFGWNRPFVAEDLPHRYLAHLADAGMLDCAGSALRSKVRFSTLADQIFVHSSFPTEEADAVFFGPDTYRFTRLIGQSVGKMKSDERPGKLRILDIGAGSGAGGLHAASRASQLLPSVTLTDINRRALRFCTLNAALNLVQRVECVESDLYAEVDGYFDLILSNPPYLVDPKERLYRHGGALGFELSLQIAEQGVSRLTSGGCLVLYTGSAIFDGYDPFHEALSSRLSGRGVTFTYEEIDPDVFGEELDLQPYGTADRIAAVSVVVNSN